jgi:hypothetical protein
VISRQEIDAYNVLADNVAVLKTGLVGGGSTLMGVILSNISEIEAWLRVSSLLVGIAVGIATLWQICRRKR